MKIAGDGLAEEGVRERSVMVEADSLLEMVDSLAAFLVDSHIFKSNLRGRTWLSPSTNACFSLSFLAIITCQ